MAAPEISHSELAAFHAAHFCPVSVNHFSEQFLGPVEEYNGEEEYDDNLGYYEDGVKRTLTDEQIAMFRHSEIQALLRERRQAEEAKANSPGDSQEKSSPEAGELEDAPTTAEAGNPLVPEENYLTSKYELQKSKKAKKAGQKKSFYKRNNKPDLRKRTWDKVDGGLDGLSYDDEGSSQAQSSAPQRRRISYDD